MCKLYVASRNIRQLLAKKFIVYTLKLVCVDNICLLTDLVGRKYCEFTQFSITCQNYLSFRTVGPCGMNKGDIKTTIPAGLPLTVTWHLGYPHGGEIILEFSVLNRQSMDLQKFTERAWASPTMGETRHLPGPGS